MSRAPHPPKPGPATLGDLLRREGIAVGEPPAAEATTAAPPPLDLGGATKIVIRREKKGRGGKTATVIEGIRLPPSGLERIARELKRALGCGASIEGGTIVVQGDLAARIEPWLARRGAKRIVVGN